MLIRVLLIAALASGAVCAATKPDDDLASRAAALRAELADADSAQPPTPRIAMQRQLLTSIERRLDLARTRTDMIASDGDTRSGQLLQTDVLPLGVLEADDLRRLSQELDLAIDAGTRRLALARADREAAATRLVQAVAHLRELEDGGSSDADVIALAKLEAELAESATAELDAIVAVVEVEQQSERAQRDAIAKRLATKSTLSKRTACLAHRDAASEIACVARASMASVSTVMKFWPTHPARLASSANRLSVVSTSSRNFFASCAVGAAVEA